MEIRTRFNITNYAFNNYSITIIGTALDIRESQKITLGSLFLMNNNGENNLKDSKVLSSLSPILFTVKEVTWCVRKETITRVVEIPLSSLQNFEKYTSDGIKKIEEFLLKNNWKLNEKLPWND